MRRTQDIIEFFSNINKDDIDIFVGPGGKEYLQATVTVNAHTARIGPRVTAGSAVHRKLMEALPRLFTPIAAYQTPPAKKQKAIDVRRDLMKSIDKTQQYTLGFKLRKEMFEFIRKHGIKTLDQLREARNNAEPFQPFIDAVSKLPMTVWKELGLMRRTDVDAFLRSYQRTHGEQMYKHMISHRDSVDELVARYLYPFQLHVPQLFRENNVSTQYTIAVDGIAMDAGKFVYDVFDMILPIVLEYQGEAFRSCSIFVKTSYIAWKPGNGSRVLQMIQARQFDAVREYVEDVQAGRATEVNDQFDEYDAFTPNHQIIGNTAERTLSRMSSNMVTELDSMDVSKGSGFLYLYARNVNVWISGYNVLRGESWVDLPQEIKNKKACINPQNYNDDYCFQDCLTIAKHSKDGWKPDSRMGVKPERITERVKEYRSVYSNAQITFPMPLDRDLWDVAEGMYECNIYVWRLHDGKPVPQAPSQDRFEHTVILLYIASETRAHYVWVHRPSALLKKMSIAVRKDTLYPCPRCCYCLTTESALESHRKLCKQTWEATPVMPHNAGRKQKGESKDAYEQRKLKSGRPSLKFTKFDAILDVPAFILFDLETFARRVHYVCNQAEKEPPMLNQQVVNSGMMVVIDNVKGGVVTFVQRFFGDNTMRDLIEAVKEQCQLIFETYMREPKGMIMTDEDKATFNAAKSCSLCNEDFKSEEKPVRHHYHYSGKFLGAAHSNCNFKATVSNGIPVLAHNLTGFDGHFVTRAMCVDDLISKDDESQRPRIGVVTDSSQKIKMMSWEFEDKKWKDQTVYDKKLANAKLGPGRDVIVSKGMNVSDHGIAMQLVDDIGVAGRCALLYIAEIAGSKKDLDIIMTFLRRLDAKGRAYINYKLTGERFWADTGLQNIRREIRGAVAGWCYVDADMRASVLTIMSQFFARRDVDCAVLTRFAKERDEMCAAEGFEKEEYKKLINCVLYGDKMPRGVKSESLRDLAWEAKYLQEYLVEEFPEMVEELRAEKDENIGGRLFARIYFEEERTCLMSMMMHMMDNHGVGNTVSLQHDGLQFHRAGRTDAEIQSILRELEDVVLYGLGYEIGLVAKPMSTKIIVPADYTPTLVVEPSNFAGDVISSSKLRQAVIAQKKIRRVASNNKWRVLWMDSNKHLQDSLDKCAKSLTDKDFKLSEVFIDDSLKTRPTVNEAHLRELMRDDRMAATIRKVCEGREITPETLTFMICRRKGVYPYDWLRDYEVFDEGLPGIEAFKTLQHRQMEGMRSENGSQGLKDHVEEMQQESLRSTMPSLASYGRGLGSRRSASSTSSTSTWTCSSWVM